MPIFRQNEQVCVFLTQVWPKIELGLEIKKCNIGIKTINDGKIARVKKDVNITSDK